MGRYKSTRIDEESKCCILLAIKITAGTVVGMGEGSPLYDPGSKLYYWEGESNARITLSDGKKKTSEVYYCYWNNTIPKQVAPIDSIWTDCCCIMQLVHVQLLLSHAADMVSDLTGPGCLIE